MPFPSNGGTRGSEGRRNFKPKEMACKNLPSDLLFARAGAADVTCLAASAAIRLYLHDVSQSQITLFFPVEGREIQVSLLVSFQKDITEKIAWSAVGEGEEEKKLGNAAACGPLVATRAGWAVTVLARGKKTRPK